MSEGIYRFKEDLIGLPLSSLHNFNQLVKIRIVWEHPCQSDKTSTNLDE